MPDPVSDADDVPPPHDLASLGAPAGPPNGPVGELPVDPVLGYTTSTDPIDDPW